MKSLSVTLITATLAFGGASAQAARFVKLDHARNPDFTAIVDFSLALTENGALGNCGKAAIYEVTVQHESETPAEIVKLAYFHDSTQTDYVTTKTVRKSRPNIEKAVDQLTAIRYLATPPTVMAEERQLKDLVLSASHQREGVRLFSGVAGYSAPNVESELNTLALFDETTSEVLIVNAGFCE